MIIKDLRGDKLEISATDGMTIGDLRNIIYDKIGGSNPSMIFIGNGRSLRDSELLNPDHAITIVKQYLEEKVPELATHPLDPTDQATPADAPDSVPDSAPAQLYERIYTNTQLQDAIDYDGMIILNILSLLAQLNPFILSHIANNPDLVKNEISAMLNDDAFRLTVRCEFESQDPIQRILNEIGEESNSESESYTDSSESESETESETATVPSVFTLTTEASYESDRAAVLRLLDALDYTLDSFDIVKDLYLFLDRNEEATLLNIRQS